MSGTKCFKCDLEFMTNNALLGHLTREYEIQVSDDAPCEFCGKKVSIKGLPRHLRSYHGVSPFGFWCMICDKLFKTQIKKKDISYLFTNMIFNVTSAKSLLTHFALSMTI